MAGFRSWYELYTKQPWIRQIAGFRSWYELYTIPRGSVRWQFSGCQYKSYTKRRGSVRMDILSVRRPLIRLVACFRRSSVQSLLCSATTVPVLVPTDPKRQKPLLVQYLLSSPPQNQSKSDFLTHYITVLVVL